MENAVLGSFAYSKNIESRRMDATPFVETKLNNNQDPLDYQSFGLSTTNNLATDSQEDDEDDADFNNLPHAFPMASGKPDLAIFGETDKEGQGMLMALCAISTIFATGVTIALILHIHLGPNPVFIKGGLVTDHDYCTALGQKVLDDHGSSVDTAIAATLCLGIVHPHMSGIGGGGLMLIYDIHQNEAKVVNFLETAPHDINEDVLQKDLEQKPGLQVGVPGILRGLHRAHNLYGRMPWEDLLKRAATVARDGFNVSLSLAENIAKIKDKKLSGRFRSLFFPGGHALRPGSFLRMPGLATVLEAGLSNFYTGSLSREIEEEVKASGGVLSRKDIANYNAEVVQPVEGQYLEYKILVTPPPSVGVALISALSILEGFNLTQNSSVSDGTYHWIAESLKAALSMASGLGDPTNDSNTELLAKMLSKSHADALAHQMISSSHASPPEHDSHVYYLQGELVASQVTVIGPDGVIVSVVSSLSRPFGSKIVTPSGVFLNSRLLHFSWPSQGGLPTNQRNRVQPGKRSLSSLMPTIVVPPWQKCGFYLALSNSDGDHSLSGITQVLINVLYYHKNINDSLSMGRLHPQLRPNILLVDSEFPEPAVEGLREKGHVVNRVETLSVVRGIQRNYVAAIASVAS